MTVKEFFKGSAFKALATLLSITIVCGGVLAVANDVFYVSEEEKEARVYKKLLDNDLPNVAGIISETFEFDEGVVNKIVPTEKGDLLINATGNGGFKGGTVTVWVLCGFEKEQFTGIKKVLYDTDEAQTLMANFNSSYYENFASYNTEIVGGAIFSTDADEGITNVVTGTTKSSTAMMNAVNSALSYVRENVLGGGTDQPDNPQPEQPKLYVENIKSVDVKVSGKTVSYAMTVKSLGDPNTFDLKISVTDGKIVSYEITKNGSTEDLYANQMYPDIAQFMIGKTYDELKALIGNDGTSKVKDGGVDKMDSSLHTGASYSNLICLIGGAYATGNYEAYLAEASAPAHAEYYKDNMKSVEASSDGSTVSYKMTVKSLGDPNPFDFKISVTDGKITSYEITKNGSTEDLYANKMYPDIAQFMIGKTYDELKALIGNDGTSKVKDGGVDKMNSSLQTGASYSNLICLIAGAYATGNYDLYL